jgi:glycosyltransferase involved in cell wall biosynthesis
MRSYGNNLAASLNTYAYMFCWDQTEEGRRVGYPSEYFAETASTMTAFLTDTLYLRDELASQYRLPLPVLDRIVPLFTPAQCNALRPSVARRVMDSGGPGCRQTVLWAGRLDRQKRFDLVQEIARLMPDVSFWCWGEALLDNPPDTGRIPANMVMKGRFDSFDDLPLTEAGVWLFTSAWEGMPTTIIELATRGVAVVATAVGGVSELVHVDSGWPIAPDSDAAVYVDALRHALVNPQEAMYRAERLQSRVTRIYTEQVYDESLAKLLAAERWP